ncbi:MAG: hypothetical protein ABIG61_04675 [Planctomycetota bacterium]
MIEQETNSEHRCKKKAKRRRVRIGIWLLFDVIVLVILLLLLTHKPSDYIPVKAVGDGTVSKYLTHELATDFYNNVQVGEPFDLIVREEGIADIISHGKWPFIADGIAIEAPTVYFGGAGIKVIGLVNYRGVNFAVTVFVEPSVDEAGMLHLELKRVKLGVVNITLAAKIIAKQMYQSHLSVAGRAGNEPGARVAGALLGGEAFVPVFNVDGKAVRIGEVKMLNRVIIIRFLPEK